MKKSPQANINRAIILATSKLDFLKIENANGRLRIRCRKKDLQIFKHTYPATPEGLNSTLAIARQIESDYYLNRFDPTLVRYGLATEPKVAPGNSSHQNSVEVREPDLKEIWESYKGLKTDTANVSKQKVWTAIDRWLNECPAECLQLQNAGKFLVWLRTRYRDGSLRTKLLLLRSAVNLAIELGQPIKNNPFGAVISLLDIDSKKIEIYSKEECKTILEAFKTGQFDNDNSAYSSKHYAGYVEFRIRTGCRPSEAIAITWNDIKILPNGKYQIIFNKRYTGGEILQGTKNGMESRIFPCNAGMIEFLDNLPKIPNDNNLIFPAIKGGYINDAKFSNSYWQPITTKLFAMNAISKRLPYYDIRHSFITWLIRDGIDIATIGAICGNSSKTIMKYYLASDENVELPEF